MNKIQRPTGTLDYFPEDLEKISYVRGIFEDIAEKFNYKPYKTPTFEYTELFARGVGETTDIVNKEMFTFIPRENQDEKESITLKPEGTAGMVRLFIQGGLMSKKPPIKMQYYTPCFRNERNQKGRFKEFHQLGIEVLGSDSYTVDAEVILLAYEFFERLGLMSHITLEINSVGNIKSRKAYNEKLKDYLKDSYDDLCDDCKDRFEKNPIRIIDCKEERCKEITENAPLMIDNLDDKDKKHFENVKKLLDVSGAKYIVNPKIVRGLDYYTNTAFEFVSKDIGSQSTVCGGGRYNGLVKELGGQDISGVGFGIGVERLIMALDELKLFPSFKKRYNLYIASLGEKAILKSFQIVNELRKKSIVCDSDHMNKSLKSQMKYADDMDAEFVLIIGDSEIENNKAVLKNMKDSSQEEIDLDIEKIYEAIK